MERDDSQALGVSFVLAKTNLNPWQIVHRHRFRGIRILLQTSWNIRSMVLGKFYFLYPQVQKEEDVSNYVLINPKKDQFQFADHHARNGDGHPRAALKPPVERMGKVFIGNGSFFAPSNFINIEILQSLPSLRRVDLKIGTMVRLTLESESPEVGLVEVGSGNWRIYTGSFPDLAAWAGKHKATFPATWQPFRERGVSLLGWRREGHFAGKWCFCSKRVWLNTSSDIICMNLCEALDDYYRRWD
ncbi:hypothetical protein BDP55DRAFT_637597 [Colletotrichum godetiae]|uniref:Uncharacterized protein n=1 Tax=Colletotrichum godetiae TaxID=1209918 RepID=A0AAJ0ABY6_9PEZI|nr:uncharacterized protein BDP55DRAFT_637597 [Colletotrichum godetiae]KAK1658792.1 hypothetical protein BDP55DRAFT_637597 [Colletotrichum godetiae]